MSDKYKGKLSVKELKEGKAGLLPKGIYDKPIGPMQPPMPKLPQKQKLSKQESPLVIVLLLIPMVLVVALLMILIPLIVAAPALIPMTYILGIAVMFPIIAAIKYFEGVPIFTMNTLYNSLLSFAWPFYGLYLWIQS